MTPARELFSRTACTDGRHVVTLRCLEADGDFVVECAVGAEREEVVGPYAFADARDARRFVDEATLALEFLGCQVG